MKCPDCGTENRPEAQFCKQCAAPLVEAQPETVKERPVPVSDSQYAYDVFISYADADCAWVEGYLLDVLTLQ